MLLGAPSGSTLSLHRIRRYSRTILVSHLIADEPLTATSFFWVDRSSSVGGAERPGASLGVGDDVAAAVAAAVVLALACAVWAGAAEVADFPSDASRVLSSHAETASADTTAIASTTR